MASAQIINCIVCKEPVRPRQQGLQCDGCFRWNHRVCNTGISLEAYRAAVNEGAEIEWQCEFCQHPDADSTMEDVSLPDPPPAESSLEDSAVDSDLLPQQPPETWLHQEARLVSIQIQLVSDGKLSRIQRRKYRLLQSKIFKYWEDYSSSEITARHLLKLCSYVNGPATRC